MAGRPLCRLRKLIVLKVEADRLWFDLMGVAPAVVMQVGGALVADSVEDRWYKAHDAIIECSYQIGELVERQRCKARRTEVELKRLRDEIEGRLPAVQLDGDDASDDAACGADAGTDGTDADDACPEGEADNPDLADRVGPGWPRASADAGLDSRH